MLHFTNQDPIDVFTTNYDSIIEGYCRDNGGKRYNVIDGFEYDPSVSFKKWNESVFDKERIPDSIYLFKLHGSLNWKQHRQFGVVKLEDVEEPMKKNGQYLR